MNYQFNLDDWLPKFPLTEVHGSYSGNDITSPCDLCNNELLRKGMRDQFDWGDSVPIDVFVMSRGEPENRSVTKIGGLPYRPADAPWPRTSSNRSMALLAQFNFMDSTDLVGDLPGELLLVFGDDSDGLVAPLHFEWQMLGLDNLVEELPGDCMRIAPCFGNRCRTVSFPDAVRKEKRTKYPTCNGKDVWSWYWLLQYQATQIGRAPFFVQRDDRECSGSPLCTIASVQPDAHSAFPWVNVPEPLCPEEEWPEGGDQLMIGDLGCIYIFIEKDGTLHTGTSFY